jgi:hypothetical protein
MKDQGVWRQETNKRATTRHAAATKRELACSETCATPTDITPQKAKAEPGRTGCRLIATPEEARPAVVTSAPAHSKQNCLEGSSDPR